MPEKAFEIWKKVASSDSLSERNISSKLNLSSYYLHTTDKIYLSKAIKMKMELISSPYFKQIVEVMGDEFTV